MVDDWVRVDYLSWRLFDVAFGQRALSAVEGLEEGPGVAVGNTT